MRAAPALQATARPRRLDRGPLLAESPAPSSRASRGLVLLQPTLAAATSSDSVRSQPSELPLLFLTAMRSLRLAARRDSILEG